MPSYCWPTWQSIGLRLLDRSKVFLRRAGTVILLVTVLLWVASNVPFHNGHPPNITESVAGTIGRVIEPVIKPLGFNWKIGIGLLTSLATCAKPSSPTLAIHLRRRSGFQHGWDSSRRFNFYDLTPGGAFALLIFFAFAMQCISTIAVVRRETGGWKWPILQFTYMSVLAYVRRFHVANHLIRRPLAYARGSDCYIVTP